MIEPGELQPVESDPALYQAQAGQVARLECNDGLPLLQVQYDVAQCQAPLIGCFGSWRSGKTRGGALKVLQVAARNPWREAYKHDHPTSVCITETMKVIRDSAYRELMQLLPREAVLKEWTSPQNWRVRLVNGHDIVFRPWSGALEGLSACAVWIDEAHKLDGPDGPERLWSNFVMRATDPRATGKVVVATGLPEYGFLSEKFDKPNDEGRATFLCSLRQNFYLDESTIRLLKSSTTEEEAETLIEGRWRKPPTVVYYAFGDVNLTDFEGDPRQSVDLSIDLGDKGAMLVSQRILVSAKDDQGHVSKVPGIVIVDELLPEQKSVKDALRDFRRDKPWRLDGDSKVYVDPKADRDELSAIKEIMGTGLPGGPKLVKQRPDERGYSVDYGHRCVNSAFRDYFGNHRLYINRHLPRSPRSLIPSLRAHKRKPNGDPYRDNIVDHVLDCLRYIVVDQLPLRGEQRMIRIAGAL